MQYLIYIVIALLIWVFIIKKSVTLKLNQDKLLTVVNEEKWLDSMTTKIMQEYEDIENETEESLKRMFKEKYHEHLLQRRYLWAKEILKPYILREDLINMVNFTLRNGKLIELAATCAGTIKLYWNDPRISCKKDRFNLSIN